LGDTASLALTVGGELVAPALIVLGVFARWAAIPAAFTMAVAGFWVHAADPIGDKELSLLYFAAYAAIALMGSGKYSLRRFGKSPERTFLLFHSDSFTASSVSLAVYTVGQ
jgi:putative oxidoreductase